MVFMLNPERYQHARNLRGLTKKGLADSIGITPRSVSNYESGAKTPLPDILESTADHLELPLSFFFADSEPELEPLQLSFRARSAMTASQRRSSTSAARLSNSITRWITDRFVVPAPNIPDLEGYDPESAAEALRGHWGLGTGPIDNMIHLLEQHGVRVFSIPDDCNEIDAFSFWRDEMPVVFLSGNKTAERSRTDAAHELAHLVLHQRILTHKEKKHNSRSDIEKEADRFASAFLMPAGSVHAQIRGLVDLEQLKEFKAYWKVALALAVYRIHQLGITSEWENRLLFIELSKQGFRSAEPGGIARESSALYDHAFKVLWKEGITRDQAARDVHLFTPDFNALTFASRDFSSNGQTRP